MTSFPNFAPSPPLNLTFLAHQPGAFVPLVHSHGSSESHPDAAPFPTVGLIPLDLSVWKTLIGFVLLTSQTAITPSWLATANLLPSRENAVEKDATREDEENPKGMTSGGGITRFVIGVKVS
jgi:hypothetical protein